MSAVEQEAERPRILYVEDEIGVQQAFAELLEEAGCRVTLASSASEGLAALGAQRFNLVVSDYYLPDFDGAEMLTRAAESGLLQCESLIVTGASRLDDQVAFPVLKKPIHVRAILGRLRASIPPPGRPRLLLVEDDPGVQRATARMLQRLGIEVVGAGDGAEALQLLQQIRPALVVTDLRMPGMSGVELVTRLLGAGSPIEPNQVVVYSAEVDLCPPGVEHVAKPDIRRLLQVVSRAIGLTAR